MRSQVALALTILVAGFASPACLDERMPMDFEIRASTGSIPEWMGPAESVHLSANGRGEWTRWETGHVSTHVSGSFAVPPEQMTNAWRAVRSNGYFRFAPRYFRRVHDGGHLSLWIVAHGDTHLVHVDNAYVPRVRRIFKAINRVTPPKAALHYEDIGQGSFASWWNQ